MTLDRQQCYDALLSRDERFDGRFFTAVKTTGIYCRPVCPAPAPMLKNVDFYPFAAAAEEAGFRPCRRCRPETAPGTPAWTGTTATVERAMKLIAEGALDGGASVDTLAGKLGVGDRHLRRLFDKHLGVSPLAVARTRRNHFARQLVDQTDLPFSEIAHCSGFSSVRRFNEAIRKAFGKPPTELRKVAGLSGGRGGEALLLRLPYRPPFDWNQFVTFFVPRSTPGVESMSGGSFRRTVSIDGKKGRIEVSPGKRGNVVELSVSPALGRGLVRIAERVRRLFDLNGDPEAIRLRLSGDPIIGPLVARRPGMRVPGAFDAFELAMRAVIGQQVSVAGATTLVGRLVNRFGEKWDDTECDDDLNRIFPTPRSIAAANVSEIASLGMPGSRAAALLEVARLVDDGTISLDAAADPIETKRLLQEIRGIGPWTAEYVALRALREPDAFPASDLGIRHALAGHAATPKEIDRLSENWRPWRAYAVMHLWHSLGDESASRE